MHAIPWYIALSISVPQAILIIEFGFQLFNISCKTKGIILTSLCMGIFCYFLRSLQIPYAINTLAFIVLLSLCIAFFSKIALKYCFVSVILGTMIYGALESLLLPLIMHVLGLSFDELVVDAWFNIICFVPIFVIAVLLLRYIIKKNLVLYNFGNMKPHNLFTVIAILLQALLLLLISPSIITSPKMLSLTKGMPYINLGLVLMCVFNLFTIKNIENNAQYQTKNLTLKNHLHQVESILKSAEIQRHEYARHIQTLQALIELNKVEKAQEYIDGVTNKYWFNNVLYSIDHPAISALINSKSSVAQINGVDFAVAVKCDLSGIDMPAWDLCSVLGNLLDNAIEAAIIDPQPRVAIEFKYEDGFYTIYLINNGCRITEPDRIFEAGYTTKGSVGRGYGLFIVNRLVHKYRGEIQVINRPKTTIILKLPREGDCHDEYNSVKCS